jgi:hypothetical protein
MFRFRSKTPETEANGRFKRHKPIIEMNQTQPISKMSKTVKIVKSKKFPYSKIP